MLHARFYPKTWQSCLRGIARPLLKVFAPAALVRNCLTCIGTVSLDQWSSLNTPPVPWLWVWLRSELRVGVNTEGKSASTLKASALKSLEPIRAIRACMPRYVQHDMAALPSLPSLAAAVDFPGARHTTHPVSSFLGGGGGGYVASADCACSGSCEVSFMDVVSSWRKSIKTCSDRMVARASSGSQSLSSNLIRTDHKCYELTSLVTA